MSYILRQIQLMPPKIQREISDLEREHGTNRRAVAIKSLLEDPVFANDSRNVQERIYDGIVMGYGAPQVNILELTEDGAYVSRCQYRDILTSLKYCKQPYTLLVFVHGWMHNSELRDPNLQEFRKTLAALQYQELKHQVPGKQPRKVIGLFVAWRAKTKSGDNLLGDMMRVSSYWSREKVADRISQSGVFTKVIGAIEHVTTERRQQFEDQDRTIYIGHSFGARILFTSTAQVLLYNVEMSYPPKDSRIYQEVKGVGDLVILLNPAFHASLFESFDALRRIDRKYNKGDEFANTQRPLLLCLSSEKDGATRFYPWAHAFKLHNREKRTHTLGNYPDFMSHKLITSQNDTSTTGIGGTHNFHLGRVQLERIPSVWQANNPFIIAQAQTSVINGHGDIWGEPLRDWLAGYISKITSKKRPQAPLTTR